MTVLECSHRDTLSNTSRIDCLFWAGCRLDSMLRHTWKKYDHHARAFKTLASERSKRIAKNLGIENPQKDNVCLNCHANNVPKEKRAKNFMISDGVTCEACHGGAEKWLGIHVSGVGGREENIKAGQYPTEEPLARAKLCLSCHYACQI